MKIFKIKKSRLAKTEYKCYRKKCSLRAVKSDSGDLAHRDLWGVCRLQSVASPALFCAVVMLCYVMGNLLLLRVKTGLLFCF